ncbi:Putative Alcohol dehydrogenase [Fusarium falciforme]|uniref:Putative Alcohol dehydrogenase n=1 Tax=Fusarium falciforme TaxID=195108 RepID=UPI0023004B8B|nr:Putative Alcohol dehydrogenase [Fusarium falciforme]WAO88931.1 Putative Alcohol dehydrogenase [Fusarium falciforme]
MTLSTNDTIRGVQFNGTLYEVIVTDIPAPVILNQTDAIVRITAAGICGSDLHYYRGVAGGGATPYTFGHEAIGIVSEIGDAVTGVSPGDYVVISDTIGDGHLHLDVETEGNTYFGAGEGVDGLQAEYARVPVADQNLIPVPLTRNTTSRSKEQDYLTVGDIFATAWSGVSWSGFEPGDTVAIFGAGPVGLLAAHSAKIRGASRIYIVDHVKARLELGKSIGAIPINFIESNPVEQILRHEPNGVKRSVDAVGFEALNAIFSTKRSNGGVGVVGVYGSAPGTIFPPGAPVISSNFTFPFDTFWAKGVSLRGGVVDPREVAPELVRLIASGQARPSFITSAEITIDEAPEYYRRFNRTQETKVFIHFD